MLVAQSFLPALMTPAHCSFGSSAAKAVVATVAALSSKALDNAERKKVFEIVMIVLRVGEKRFNEQEICNARARTRRAAIGIGD
jgi:hypothetical protein